MQSRNYDSLQQQNFSCCGRMLVLQWNQKGLRHISRQCELWSARGGISALLSFESGRWMTAQLSRRTNIPTQSFVIICCNTACGNCNCLVLQCTEVENMASFVTFFCIPSGFLNVALFSVQSTSFSTLAFTKTRSLTLFTIFASSKRSELISVYSPWGQNQLASFEDCWNWSRSENEWKEPFPSSVWLI